VSHEGVAICSFDERDAFRRQITSEEAGQSMKANLGIGHRCRWRGLARAAIERRERGSCRPSGGGRANSCHGLWDRFLTQGVPR
jgi:hypothetical protein